MIKFVITFALACAGIHAQVAVEPPRTIDLSANQATEWNRNLMAPIRTPDAHATTPREEAVTGQFWNGAIQNYWNVVAQRGIAANKLAIAPRGLSKGTLADGVNAFYDAKYTYNFWRPLSAFGAGDARNTSDTDNLNWLTKGANTALDPSYPGAQAAIVTFHFQTGLTTLLRKIL